MKFYIKIGVPSWNEAENWGDYHYARAMQKALEQMGHHVVIQILPEWHTDADADSDVTIHLMGLSHYKTKKGPLNVMWLISHPEKVSTIDFSRYDLLFVASRSLAENLSVTLAIPVTELLQFADTFHMYPEYYEDLKSELLFVGNSRKVYRRIIRDLMPTDYDLKIWGGSWEEFIPRQYIQGTYFPYEQLRRLYSSSAIVLNDHWDEMRQWDFINNRIFDALACKAFVLSDGVKELSRLLPGAVTTYRNRSDLIDTIDFYLTHPEDRRQKAEAGYQKVVARHGVETRMLEFLEKLDAPRPPKSVSRRFFWGNLKNLLYSKIRKSKKADKNAFE